MKLANLLAAGRRHNANDVGAIQNAHDLMVALGATCAAAESAHEPAFHLDVAVSEALGMSHGDLANLLRMALKAEYPGKDTYVWTQDVYDDAVVYEVSSNGSDTLYQRSYSILDGKVTFGDPVRVMMMRQYVAVTESDRDDLDEREFSQDQRDKMADKGQAMDDGGFPIATRQDLKNAIQAYGRAKNKAAAKRHIIKRAKALGATNELPEDWTEAAESESDEITGDAVELVEKAVKKDGTIALRIIAPGQGSSAYYPADTLKRDGPKVFTAGLHMHIDHPSISEEAERPERSIATLAGTLATDARWEENGAAGPGLYADAKVRSDFAPLIEELAPHIGVSIRATGKVSARDVGGKKVRALESFEQAKSVDFVTIAGAGGKVLDLVEAARNRQSTPEEGDDVSQEELKALQDKLAESERKQAELAAKVDAQEKREAQARLIAEAKGIVDETLATLTLYEGVGPRITPQLAANPPLKDDGTVDRNALVEKAKEAAQAENAYVANALRGSTGRVTGMGWTPPKDPTVPTLEESGKRITAALADL